MDPVLRRIVTAGTGIMLLTLALMGILTVSSHPPILSAAPLITTPGPIGVDNVTLRITTNGPHGWPTYHLKSLTIPANTVVHLTIINHDNGASTMTGPFANAEGIQGREIVDGKAAVVAPNDIAHTFTVPALGLNILVPAAPNNGTVKVVATFEVTKAGAYRWQCEAPCGTGPSGWGGPMVLDGDMTGQVIVTG